MVGDPHVAHQGVHVGAGVHPVNGPVVHPLGGVPHGCDLLGDPVRSFDRIEVAGEQAFGAQAEHQVERVDIGERVPVAVAPHGDEIGDVAEQRVRTGSR